MKRSARRKYGRCHFWFTTKSWKPSAEQIDQDHSSSDSWNNNDAAASLENSASSDEEDMGSETRAIYSIVLKLPGHSTILSSTKLPSSDNLQVPEGELGAVDLETKASKLQAQKSMDDGGSFQKSFSKLPIQLESAVDTAKASDVNSSVGKTAATLPLSFIRKLLWPRGLL